MSDYSQRMSTLEETVKELTRFKEDQEVYAEYSRRTGLFNVIAHAQANRQQDVDSGLISLQSEDEESYSRSFSPIVGLGGTTRTAHTATLTTLEWADELMTGGRESQRQHSLRRSPPRRERSRSRSPLRQNASDDSIFRRDRESSPCESTCTSRSTRRPRRPMPVTPSSPSASSTSTNTCGNSDSPVAQSRESRNNVPLVIDDSITDSEDTPRITGEIRHNVTGNEVMGFDGIPARAVFWSPPGSDEVSSYFGDDRQFDQWLEWVTGESTSSSSSTSSNCNSSSSSTSC